jgi:hypothetical protein
MKGFWCGLAPSFVLMLSVTACGGGGGDRSPGTMPTPIPSSIPTPIPTPGPTPLPRALISLVGQIAVTSASAGPDAVTAAGAEVVTVIGGETFTATADADGKFQLDIDVEDSPSNRSTLVSFIAAAAAEDSPLELQARLGSLGEVITQAGTDRVLDAAENLRVNISPLSTAESALLDELEAAGERIGAKQFQIDPRLDPQQVLTLAGAIQLALVRPLEFPLPQSNATVLSLARSLDQRRSFIRTIENSNPTALREATVAVASNPLIVGTVDATDIAAEMLLASLVVDGELPFNLVNLVDGFGFDADGSGRYFDSRALQTMTWQAQAAEIVVSLDAPVETFGFPLVDCQGDGVLRQVQTRFVTDAFRITLLGGDQAALLNDYRYERLETCPADPSGAETAASAKRIVTDSLFGALAAEEFGGKVLAASLVAVAEAPSGSLSAFAADSLDLRGDGTGAGLYNGDLTWAVTGNALDITTASGITARYRFYDNFDGTGAFAMVESRFPGGERLVDIDLLVRVPDASFVEWDATAVPGRYFQYGVGVENDSDIDPRLDGFRLRLDADNGGAQEEDQIEADAVVAIDETDQAGRALRWSVDVGGRLVLARTATGDGMGGTIFDCDPGVSGCTTYDERIQIPLARVMAGAADRLYVLEERRINSNGPASAVEPTRLIRFYDYRPL